MADNRKSYDRIVHETWAAWFREQQPVPVSERSLSMEAASPGMRELYVRIGAAVAAAERERIREMAVRTGAVCTGDEGTSCCFAALLGEPAEAGPPFPVAADLALPGEDLLPFPEATS